MIAQDIVYAHLRKCLKLDSYIPMILEYIYRVLENVIIQGGNTLKSLVGFREPGGFRYHQ
jgi:hypothetical protein